MPRGKLPPRVTFEMTGPNVARAECAGYADGGHCGPWRRRVTSVNARFSIAMAKRKRPPRPLTSKRTRAPRVGDDPPEDRAADAITIAWTVSVTAVFMADLATLFAHFYRRANPESQSALAFEAIMLLSACVIGLVSLALLPVVWHVRRVRPPLGFAVFAGSVAVAPVLVVAVRLFS